MKLKFIIFAFFLLFISLSLYGHRGIKRTNYFQSYKDTDKEIGYALNASYLRYENTFSPQLQVYYTKYLTPFFGLGLGVGTMYNKQINNTFTIDARLRVFDGMFVVVKPGLHMKKVRNSYQYLYSVGFEANYKLELKNNLLLGPVVQFDLIQDDLNFMVGVLMAYRF